MSATSKAIPKKVTKIIRKDGITYRPAGGTSQPLKNSEPVKPVIFTQPTRSNYATAGSSQGKKKTFGKVIKRADGTKIVVVDGKIVKTLKANSKESSPSKSERSNEDSSKPILINDDALSPLTDISADELPPESPNVVQNKAEEQQPSYKNPASSVVRIKRTITFNGRSSPAPLLEKPKSPDNSLSSSPILTKSFNVRKRDVDQRAQRPSHSIRKPTYVKRPVFDSRSKQTSKDVSIHKSRDHLETNRPEMKEVAPQSQKRDRRSRSPRRTRSPYRNRSPAQPRGSGKYRLSKRTKDRSRSPAKMTTSEKRSLSPKKTSPENAQSSLTSLLNEENSIGSKDAILNLIQKQAEEMLQAQHSGPIDEDKKKKLREAMESILEKRGIINPSNTKTRKKSQLRSASSDSSDGRGSPQILEKLHQKYNTSADASTDIKKIQTDPLDMEAISPCIDNISVASEEQKVSDVSHSDMEMSDEEAKNDIEDGRTPAYRKKPVEVDDHAKESSSKIIQIKLGKDEDEEAFQALAARVDGLKSSSDVQELIEAIENRIKSFLSNNIDPSNLEKKIKRYQTLVAKVVIEAESIKEKEEDNKITYHTHRRSKSKEVMKSTRPEVDQSLKATISYPVQTQEQKQPWLYQNPTPEAIHRNNGNHRTPLLHNVPEPEPEPSNYDRIQAQYVSQRVGYHVCLLCMIESSDVSHFRKHLNGKKHHEAVLTKIRQLSQTDSANVKKYKRHDLVIKCKLCDIICRGQKKYNEHANHRSHLALVQAYVKIGRVVPEPEILHDQEDKIREQLEEIQESETPAVGREYMSVKTVKDCDDNVMDAYHCSLCKTNCNSEIQVEKHVRSKKHYLIYVKVTQPDVNVQLNTAEHKKRRETSKKIVSAMKTIKQMEVMMDRNRDRIGRDAPTATVTNYENEGTPDMALSMVNQPPSSFQSQPSSFPPYSSSQTQLVPGSVPFKYQNRPSTPEQMKSQSAPYYRDPTTRFSSPLQKAPLGSAPLPYSSRVSNSASAMHDIPISSPNSSIACMSNSQEILQKRNPPLFMNMNSRNQEEFPNRGVNNTYNHGNNLQSYQNYPSRPEIPRTSRDNSSERVKSFIPPSSHSAPFQGPYTYGSTLAPSISHFGKNSGSFGSDRSSSGDKFQQNIGSQSFGESGGINEHQKYSNADLFKNLDVGPNKFPNKEVHTGFNRITPRDSNNAELFKNLDPNEVRTGFNRFTPGDSNAELFKNLDVGSNKFSNKDVRTEFNRITPRDSNNSELFKNLDPNEVRTGFNRITPGDLNDELFKNLDVGTDKFPNNDVRTGFNHGDSNRSSYSDQVAQNFQPRPQQPWFGSGKVPASHGQNFGDQNPHPENTPQSRNTPSDSHHSSYVEQTSREISWPNRPIMNIPRKPNPDEFVPSSGSKAGSIFNNAPPSNHSFPDNTRSTYSSAYDKLKQGDQQSTPAALSYAQSMPPTVSYGGPTYSHKPTYSGVYTNVRRG